MERKPTPRADIGLAVFLIVVCAAALWETREIPPGSFEPLGSAPVPQAVATAIIVLCLVVIVNATLGLRRRERVAVDDGDLVLRPSDAALVFVLTIAYGLALEFRVGTFALTTAIYLFLAIGMLVRFERKRLPWVALVGVAMGYGCQFAFTRVFVVDLPGAF